MTIKARFPISPSSLPQLVLLKLAKNAAKSFIDNVIRDKVDEPRKGSVLHCELFPLVGNHSGIYIGDGRIVQLSKSGEILCVTPGHFKGGITSAISIYVSCQGKVAVGKKAIAKRAKKMIGKHRDYNFMWDNCHQFSSGCLTGDFENGNHSLNSLKSTAKSVLNCSNWRVWDLKMWQLLRG